MERPIDQILAGSQEASERYYRLVLVVGTARVGKTAALCELASARGWPRINVNLDLSEKLLDLNRNQRAIHLVDLLDDVIKGFEPPDNPDSSAPAVILDNIEILFSRDLKVDPLRALQALSRNRTVVAAWPGCHEDGGCLTYAERGHPEYRRYVGPQATVVPISFAPEQGRDIAVRHKDRREEAA